MEFQKVTVLGGGVLATQIAVQSAYCGKEVTLWLRSKDSLTRTQPKLDRLYGMYQLMLDRMNKTGSKEDFCGGLAKNYKEFDYKASSKKVADAKNHIHIEYDLKKAVKDADIVIESISENKKMKIDLFKKLSKVMDKNTLLVTNSSSFVPSKFTKYVKNDSRFLALHFANNIWKQNITEVMRHEGTSDDAFQAAARFSKEINMAPNMINKEHSGYILNALLIPLLSGAMEMVAYGIATPEDIDRTWRNGVGATYGPCEIYDVVGLDTGYNIVKKYVNVPKIIAGHDFKAIAKLLESYIAEGKTGINSGEGFFKYDAEGNRIDND